MLCYAMLCYIILYYTILYHIILYYIILYYIILYYIILYYIILYIRIYIYILYHILYVIVLQGAPAPPRSSIFPANHPGFDQVCKVLKIPSGRSAAAVDSSLGFEFQAELFADAVLLFGLQQTAEVQLAESESFRFRSNPFRWIA